jgi:hypothetical protein
MDHRDFRGAEIFNWQNVAQLIFKSSLLAIPLSIMFIIATA